MTKRIVLKKMYIQGFRGFKEAVEINFLDEKVVFVAENGCGKTSIGEAIAWVFTGKGLFGNSRNLNVKNKDVSVARVTILYEDGTGEHKIERRSGSTNAIYYDGERIKAEDLDEIIPVDLFLTSLNPMYFLGLETATARKLIVELLPKLSKDEVLEEMDEMEREFLEKEQFQEDSTNYYLELRNKEKKEIENDLQHMMGYIDKTKEPIEIPEEVIFDNSKLLQKQKEWEQKLQNKPSQEKKEEIEKELSYLLEKKNSLVGEVFPEQIKINEIKSRIREIQTEINYIEKEEMKMDGNSLADERVLLLNEYERTKERIETMEGQKSEKEKLFSDSCPTCSQKLLPEKVKELKEKQTLEIGNIQDKINKELNRLNEIKKRGIEVSQETKKYELEKDKKLKEFQRMKEEKLNNLQKEYQLLVEEGKLEKGLLNDKEKKREEDVKSINEKGQQLYRKLQDLLNQSSGVMEAYNQELNVLQKEVTTLKEKEKEAIVLNAKREALIKAEEERKSELVKLENSMKSIDKELEKINNQIFYMKKFVLKRIQMLHEEMNRYFNKVAIRLQKHVKSTGEIKDCFEIEYEGKPIHICSLSEQMRAGMEISSMLAKIKNLEYPMFLDNAESITSYETAHKQIIEVRVKKGAQLQCKQGGTIQFHKEFVAS